MRNGDLDLNPGETEVVLPHVRQGPTALFGAYKMYMRKLKFFFRGRERSDGGCAIVGSVPHATKRALQVGHPF